MKVPWPLRGVYRWLLQTLIGLIEWRPPREALPDAAVYVVHALKAAGPPGPR